MRDGTSIFPPGRPKKKTATSGGSAAHAVASAETMP
jgi:hypothetical protein